MSKHGPITAAPMSWAECAAAGMSKAEACRHRGVSRSAADYPAKRDGLKFTHKGTGSQHHSDRMRVIGKLENRKSVAHLTEEQRDQYRVFRMNKYSQAEALAAVEGRA